MYHYPFVTFERPHCLYDWRLPELNQEFLGRFDPDYFIHLTEAVYQTLEGDNEKRASVAMRTAYHHGLETFFSLLAACVQAPECIIGWLHKYRNDELRECIRCITERRSLMNRHGFSPPSWEHIAEQFILVDYPDKTKTAFTKKSYGQLWKRFADEFLAEENRHEYNSIKHGLRSGFGGCIISAGIEDVPGVPAAPEKMKTIGGSKFGTSYYVSEPPEADPPLKKTPCFRLKSHNSNWDPTATGKKVSLISMSIRNLISYTQIRSGIDPATTRFHRPQNDEDFMDPWNTAVGVMTSSFNTFVNASDCQLMTKEEILATYGSLDATD